MYRVLPIVISRRSLALHTAFRKILARRHRRSRRTIPFLYFLALVGCRANDRDPQDALRATTVSAPTAHAIPANYFYDPAGNLRTIRDAAGNLLVATHPENVDKTATDAMGALKPE